MRKLTRKQKGFLKYYFEGRNATEAVMMVYNTTNRNSAKVIGSKLLTSANVRQVLAQGLRSQGLSIDQLAQSLKELAFAKPDKISGDTVLKANIEVLKLLGTYNTGNEPSINIQMNNYSKEMTFEEAREMFQKITRNEAKSTVNKY